MKLALVICACLVVYAYAAYPAVIWVASRLFGRKPVPPAVADAALPSVTLLIAAHDEESVIAARVENALAMDYPADRLHVVVASDGSTDATTAIVRRYAGRGVRLLEFTENRGKATVLNDAIARVETELLLLSDANTDVLPDAPRKLARWLVADPNVGAVCGRLVLTDPRTGRNADSLYWKYETFLKKCEGRLGALLGSNGAIYAIRTRDYVPIPPDTIVDDFVIPLLGKLRTDARIVYDCEAVATEETPADVSDEFRRRTRIGAGGFQAITLLWPLLNPLRGWVAFTFLSHKILRWLCPFFLLGALVIAAWGTWASPDAFFRLALLAQVAFYAVSAIATCIPPRVRAAKPLRLAPMFTSMNLALFFGFWRWVGGGQKGTWRRTARTAERHPALASPEGAPVARPVLESLN